MSAAFLLVALAALVAAATWIALHAIPMSDLDVVPTRCRHRIAWWHQHARWLYACCAAAAVLGLAASLAQL
ncbi:MAG TPA: hypothetical protein VKB75_08530 [Jatrophihabitans sp.]|nr:hypothetical protein [Jatrophihabitans sp.]